MRKLLNEFKAFAVKGNVVDLAIGVVIGSAFGKIVTSLVSDIVMPVLGLVLGKVNFKELNILLVPKVGKQPEITLNYGNFIQTVIDFAIIAFSIFMVVKLINNIRKRFEKQREEEAKPAQPSKTEVLLEEIRDLLKKEK